mgnify:FL=1
MSFASLAEHARQAGLNQTHTFLFTYSFRGRKSIEIKAPDLIAAKKDFERAVHPMAKILDTLQIN